MIFPSATSLLFANGDDDDDLDDAASFLVQGMLLNAPMEIGEEEYYSEDEMYVDANTVDHRTLS